jgi:hypothetical protein
MTSSPSCLRWYRLNRDAGEPQLGRPRLAPTNAFFRSQIVGKGPFPPKTSNLPVVGRSDRLYKTDDMAAHFGILDSHICFDEPEPFI